MTQSEIWRHNLSMKVPVEQGAWAFDYPRQCEDDDAMKIVERIDEGMNG